MACSRDLLWICATLLGLAGCSKPKPPVIDATLPLLRDEMVRATLASYGRSPTPESALVVKAKALHTLDSAEKASIAAHLEPLPATSAINAERSEMLLSSSEATAVEQQVTSNELSRVPSPASPSLATLEPPQPPIASPIQEPEAMSHSTPLADESGADISVEPQEPASFDAMTVAPQGRQSATRGNTQSTREPVTQSGYTGFGAGDRFTGESAGQSGYTGFGAGKGYTGAGAGDAGFTGSAGTQLRGGDTRTANGSSIVIILPTPFGLYVQQLPTY